MTLVLRTEGEETDGETDVLEAPEIGFRFEMPESYRSLKGTQNWSASYLDDGVLQISMEYYAVPEEQIDAYMEYKNAYIDAVINGGEEPEAPNPAWSSGSEFAYVFVVQAINGGRGEEELRQSLREYNGYRGDDFSWLEEVGRDRETTFFVGQYAQLEEEAEEYREGMGEFYDEFAALASDRDTFLSALTLTEPQWPRELAVGDTIVCETTDLEGNPVNCGDVFSESKVTMINVWATWCGPCKGELPELAEMAKDFEAQGCRIIGVCMDAEDEQMAELASSILAEAGVEYLNLMVSENVSAAFPITAYPTSFFVDSEGKLLLEPVVGANLEGYAEALAEALVLVG